MRTATNSDQLHGTLDMLVLKVLEGGPLHGYAIALRLERLSKDVLSVGGRYTRPYTEWSGGAGLPPRGP